MRTLIYALVVLTAAVLVALYAREDPGYVVLNFRGWTLESSFVVFAVGLLVTFAAFYGLVRLWQGGRHLPRWLRERRRERRRQEAHEELTQGLVDLIEGRWAAAEQHLVRRLPDSDVPMLHYLAAARAAQEQGARDRRDRYLELARSAADGSEVAVGLARAALQRGRREMEEAARTLRGLLLDHPGHRQVLGMLMDLYTEMKAWDRLLDLLPELRRHRVVPLERLDELEREAYLGLMEQAAEREDVEALRAAWRRMPKALRRREELAFEYARRLYGLDPESADEIVGLTREVLARRWSERLVYLYGLVRARDGASQLAQAEKWLRRYGESAVLLLTLGRLCIQHQLWDKARSYLEASLALDPRPETFRELGALMERLGEERQAAGYYRQALSLIGQESLPALPPRAEEKAEQPRGEVTVIPAGLPPAGEAAASSG